MAATWWTDPSELDDDQKAIVSLPSDGNHLILGPPGSGKTNLLLLRATYLHKKGTAHLAILTFGRVLREFLAAGTVHYPFSEYKIQTYIRWATALLRENDVHVDGDEAGNLEERRANILACLKELASENASGNQFDSILLDEAQDYSKDEIEAISKFTKRLFAVGDKGQQITDKHGALDALKASGVEVHTLKNHYRNGLEICRVADGIRNLVDHADGLEASSNYDEKQYPSSAKVFGGLDVDEQAKLAVGEIETQLDAYPNELIGVLCPRLQELKVVASVLTSSSVSGHVHVQQGEYTPFQPDRRVIVTTIHGAKGLEFRTLHLLGMDEIRKFRTQKNMAYTAVTRCKTTLTIYHKDSLPGYLEKGLQACEGISGEDPTLDDLFL